MAPAGNIEKQTENFGRHWLFQAKFCAATENGD